MTPPTAALAPFPPVVPVVVSVALVAASLATQVRLPAQPILRPSLASGSGPVARLDLGLTELIAHLVPGPVPRPVSCLVPVPSVGWLLSRRPSDSRPHRPSRSRLVPVWFQLRLQGVPGPIPSLIAYLVPRHVPGSRSCLPYRSRLVLVRSPSVPAPAARGSLSCSRSRCLVFHPLSIHYPFKVGGSLSELSRASSHCSSSSWLSQNRSSSLSKPGSPA